MITISSGGLRAVGPSGGFIYNSTKNNSTMKTEQPWLPGLEPKPEEGKPTKGEGK